MKRLVRLQIIFGILLLLALLLTFWPERKVRSSELSLPDSSLVERIDIQHDGQQMQLIRRVDGSWRLQDTLAADRALIRIALSFVHDIQFRRNLSQQELELVDSLYDVKGVKVTIHSSEEQIPLRITSDADNMTTYLFFDQQWQEVFIPGYQTFVGGIFFLTSSQWRDKTLFSTSWLDLKNVSVDHALDALDLNISYQDDFFKVQRVTELDSAALMDYLTFYENFRVNQYITRTEILKLDSAYDFSPEITIQVSGIGREKANSVIIYEMESAGFRFGKIDNKEDYFAIAPQRLEVLLRPPGYFEK